MLEGVKRFAKRFEKEEGVDIVDDQPQSDAAKVFIKGDGYSPCRALPAGGGGQCILVRSRTTEKCVVIKRLKKKAPCSRPSHEVAALTQYMRRHPNIVEVLDVIDPKGKQPKVYMEYCCGGDLESQFNHFRWEFPVKGDVPALFILHLFASLVEALAFIHHGIRIHHAADGMTMSVDSNHIAVIHADVKPANILIRWLQKPRHKGLPDFVLADFGISQPADSFFGIGGTYGWEAPEVDTIRQIESWNPRRFDRMNRKKGLMTTASDVYSFALTVINMMVWEGVRTNSDPNGLTLPPSLQPIEGLLPALKQCLLRNASQRPTMKLNSLEGTIMKAFMSVSRARDEKMTDVREHLGELCWARPPDYNELY